MDNQIMKYGLIGIFGIFAVIVIAYLFLMRKMKNSDMQKAMKLRAGTEGNAFSSDVIYQKLYMIYIKTPFIKRYLIKIRRRLEIINIDDEYMTRKQTATILTRGLIIVILLSLLIFIFASGNVLLLCILLIFEVFILETLMDGMVDKMDNKLLKQQIDLFSEIRHAYHESNMVEEAIYQVSQNDEVEVSRQAEKIYEILISDEPEVELEKYYDVAPNSYLKEFAGVSYLTKEFGDRKVDGASLYLKNLNNITQEMQLEILKRDKLDYVFQSLSFIAVAPILLIEPLKYWAVGQFSFTSQFYDGKGGLIVQTIILVLTFVCYTLIRKVKDTSSTNANVKNTENPWQAKVYKRLKKIIDLVIPKKGTKDYRKIIQLLKDAASKQKIEWLYVNKIAICIVSGIVSLLMFNQLHKTAINYIYEEPTSDYNILGQMSETDERKAMQLTEQDNFFLDMFKGKQNTTVEQIEVAMEKSKYYEDAGEEEIKEANYK